MTQDKTITLTQEQLESLIQNAIKDATNKESVSVSRSQQPQAPPYPLDAPFELVNCGLKTVVGTALGVVELVGQGAFALIDTITLNRRR